MTRTLLVVGSAGQVGRALVDALAPLGEVRALDRTSADLTSPDALRSIVRAARPAVVVNAAAYTAVDRAESEPDVARAVNALAPGVLAEAAQAVGACIVHYSTDYVFDGSGTRPWREADPTGPLSVYGRTKLAGEQAVMAACSRHLILRTSWVMSPHGTNFVKTMLRLAQERTSLRVVADQVGAPTTAALLATVTARVLGVMTDAPAGDPRWGVYHVAAGGETSWHGVAQRVVTRAQSRGASLACAPDGVVAITTAEYPTPARRPANSRLDTAKLRATFGVALPQWTEGVDMVVDQLCPVGVP